MPAPKSWRSSFSAPCPVSQLYEARIEKLYRDYKDKGVALVAINPNNPDSVRLDEESYSDVTDSLDDMKVRAEYKHLDYPYLYDGDKRGGAGRPRCHAADFHFRSGPQTTIRRTHRRQSAGWACEIAGRPEGAIDALLAGQPIAVANACLRLCHEMEIAVGKCRKEMAKIEAEPVTVTLASRDDLKKLRTNPTGKLLLVNFWANVVRPVRRRISGSPGHLSNVPPPRLCDGHRL